MRLLLDAMCGGLRPYLRVCGHDVAYALEREVETDDAIRSLASEEDRTVVTRGRDLATPTDGDAILLTQRDVADQLRELAAAGVPLEPTEEPVRCGCCNGRLDELAADEATPAYAPSPAEQPVWQCRDCRQCFWRGSHWDQMTETLEAVREAASVDDA